MIRVHRQVSASFAGFEGNTPKGYSGAALCADCIARPATIVLSEREYAAAGKTRKQCSIPFTLCTCDLWARAQLRDPL